MGPLVYSGRGRVGTVGGLTLCPLAKLAPLSGCGTGGTGQHAVSNCSLAPKMWAGGGTGLLGQP